MTEMVERVTRAIAAKSHEESCLDDVARAAIAAMREPTEAMCDAGELYSDGHPGKVWRDMIDAALNEPTKE